MNIFLKMCARIVTDKMSKHIDLGIRKSKDCKGRVENAQLSQVAAKQIKVD